MLAGRYDLQAAGALESLRGEVGDRLMRQAAEVHRQFARRPHLRAIWEPKILSGAVELEQVLAAICPNAGN